MGWFKNTARKLFSASTGAGRFIGTLLDKNKKVKDFKLFKNQAIGKSYGQNLIGVGSTAAVALGIGAAKNMNLPKTDKQGGLLGNLFSGSGNLQNLLKNKNLQSLTGIDLGSLFGGSQTPKGLQVGGGIEFGSQAQKNLWLPFVVIAAVGLVLYKLFSK
jgi:hypothetical protein